MEEQGNNKKKETELVLDKKEKKRYITLQIQKGKEKEEYAHNPDREYRSSAGRRLRKCVRKLALEPGCGRQEMPVSVHAWLRYRPRDI